jgi:hypothetical protein
VFCELGKGPFDFIGTPRLSDPCDLLPTPPQGQGIHEQRRMVPCKFMEGGNCTGLVHDRFQVAYMQVGL